ncbi:transcriptional adapter 3-A-like isoform X2 [Branchiostoma floridae]|uniref:Transcriptional adapter 3-A-like isoform X2 n=1 Tax=Branchiostoma floridae TaxID=7739 RepID=A0A9J7MZ77_BRAFL|nr:transcriptional adapter 3-A-like isoform X2 [Branchiostoma floridae]
MREKMTEKECPLQFHDFKPVDHSKLCPRFTQILSRTEEEGIGEEELDTIQLELETLLASVSKRMRQLEGETQVLIDWQDRKDKKGSMGKVHKDSDHPHSGKRGRPEEKASTKKFKGDTATTSSSTGKWGASASTSHSTPSSHSQSGPGRPKSKQANIQQKMQEYEFTDDPLDVPRIPKNDAPNRFWQSLEPYVADITHDDLKVLEELMKPVDEESEYYKVPPLGKHYTQRWAQEDLLEEQKEGARVNEKGKSKSALGGSSSANISETSAMLKKVDSNSQKSRDTETNCPFGPLTQRLVSALVEENIMTPIDDTSLIDSSTKGDGQSGEASSSSPRSSSSRPFSVPHTRALEARIREELINQGLIESEDQAGEDTEDEVLSELKKRQAELKALVAHNRSAKQRLHKLAKEEIRKQELRQKARVIDNEVMDCFRKIMAARQKKRTPTKKERDAAVKALKERDAIMKLLDS